MLFQKPKINYGIIPNWLFGIFAWLQLFVIFEAIKNLVL